MKHTAELTVRDDFTIDQPLHLYTETDHEVWRSLYARQSALLEGRACDEYLAGLHHLDMGHERVPVFEELNQKLMAATGWRIVAVTGLVPDAVFFEHLANRRFPVTWWVRAPEEIDYLQEPDCFHDVFGHVPLLINPVFADYMQAYGEGGIKAEHLHVLPMLARLYWYTVEFGLIQTDKGLRIYGAGIVSSKTESIYALESEVPNRIGFDLTRILLTEYKIDDVQKTYFVIDGFDKLMSDTRQDFTQMYLNLDGLSTFKPTDILAQDRVINKGVTP